jgi:O-antigen/teichoic acid export membrane protein
MIWLSTLPVVLALMAAGPTLLGMLYGPEYVAAWPVTLLFLIMVLLAGVNESADRALAAAERMWLSTGNKLLWALLFVALALALIPRGMAMGYALALLLSFSLYVLVQLGWLRRLFRVRVASLVPLLALSAVFMAIAWLIAGRLVGPVQIVAAGALVLLAMALLWRLFLHSDEREALRQRVLEFRANRRFRRQGDSDARGA